MALNLQPNQEGLLECIGRVQGEYPIYLPYNSMPSLSLTEEARWQRLHGGVGLTMAKVRSRYCFPRLRQLVRKVRGACHGCKWFQALAYEAPPPGNLPTTRTHGSNPYQVTGVDYVGPIRYRVSKQREGKAYVLLYACSLTRGVYLDILRIWKWQGAKEVHRAPRETRVVLLRQRPNLRWCCRMDESCHEGRTTAKLPLHQSDQMAVQPNPCPVEA